MKAVILEGNAVNPGDLSWEPVRKICDPVIYEGTIEADKIERIGDAEIVFWDERLSTVAAEKFLIESADVSRAKRKKVIDKMAAVYILQGYLDSRRGDF